MQKKWHTLFQRESDTQFFKSAEKAKKDYARAKDLYFINFASHVTMKKNGEFKEYCKYNIPKEIEYEWSRSVKNRIMNGICNESTCLNVVRLANINLPKEEIVAAFHTLATSPQCDSVLSAVVEMKPLFELDMYKIILDLFEVRKP